MNSRLVSILGITFCFLLMTSCQSTSSQSGNTAKSTVHLTGQVVIQSLPPQRLSLYIEEQSPFRRSIETSTTARGLFSVSLPPGIYLFKALPSFSCPIRNKLILPPSDHTVRITLTTFPLSFIHCKPSTLSVQGNTETVVRNASPATISIRGLWIPAPSKPISIFASSTQSSSSIQEIPVQPDGTFLWHPVSRGRFQIQAAPPGLCPLIGTITIQEGTRYLEIRDSSLLSGSPCPTPLIRTHSGAFTPSVPSP